MTRRQELNRQAQRSHRQRKEQYVRTMETEVSRLREAYTQEISAANVAVQQHRHMVHSLGEENDILKDILSAHGIAYESELESRKSDRPSPGYHQSSPFNSSMGSSTLPTLPPSNAQNNAYTTPPTTVSSNMSPRNGAPSDLSPKSEPSHAGHSHGHAHQCEPMGFMDRSGGMMNGPIQDLGGVFETDPQLQIDFILTYVPIPPLLFFSSLLFFVLTNFAVWNHHVANIPITSVDDPSLKQTTKTCPFPATR